MMQIIAVGLAIILALFVGCAIGRGVGPSPDETRFLLDMAESLDQSAASLDILDEARQAEQEAHSLLADMIQSKIDGLREQHAQQPSDRLGKEIDAGLKAHRQVVAGAELLDKYRAAAKVESERLRALATSLREYVD